jgi:citrate lyase subunit beta/citryl-CoA lyase
MRKLYRSYLYCSGNKLENLQKALTSEADTVTVDLEDSVPQNRKVEARENTFVELSKIDMVKPVFVKTNPPSSKYGLDDIARLSRLPLAGFRLPKTNSVEEIREVHAILQGNRFQGCIQPMIETARGAQNIDAIADSSHYIAQLIVGEEDLRNDLGCARNELGYTLQRVVVACRAVGLLPPVLSVWPFLSDPDGLRSSSIEGRNRGFFGRLCVHPSQVATVNEVFTPEPDELTRAARVVELFNKAEVNGATAIKDDDGNYLSVWTRDNAQRVLALNNMLGD